MWEAVKSVCFSRMKTLRTLAILVVALVVADVRGATYVKMNSSVGTMIFELYDLEKPLTVQLFLSWLDQGNYAGTYVHRATPDYVAQSGFYGVQDFGPPFGVVNVGLPLSPDFGVVNEINNGNFISNTYGTLAMVPWTPVSGAAQTYVTSGFVFNLNDNTALDDTDFGGGFPVFGHLVSGWDAFALLNPTNGNPAVRVTNFSSTLSELPIRSSAGTTLTYDDFIYLNMERTAVPEPTALMLLVGGGVFGAIRMRRSGVR